MNITANNIIKLFIDAIGQDAFKDFYDFNWEARKKETQKLLRFQIDENNSGDLKLLIQRWTKSKTSRPTWKVIKLFMNEDLLPEDNLVYQLFPDISGKEQYLTFRRKIFSAYFITNLFDSLDNHGFLDPSSKEMIQNGIRLFYRHFLVTKEPSLSQEETHNPMFCMLYRFLLKDDMGYDFNTDTAQYFKRYLF